MPHASSTGRGGDRAARSESSSSSSRPSLLRNPFRRSDAASGPRAMGRPFTESIDRDKAGAFGLGLALGVLAGAGVALLMAPHSGIETRARMARGARSARGRAADSWADLTDSVRDVARRNRKRLQRSVTRGRWAAEDLYESRGRRRRHEEEED